MRFINIISSLLAFVLICTVFPLGVLAENQSISVQTTGIVKSSVNVSKDSTANGSMAIQSMDEVANINENSNIDDEIIVIYQNNNASVGDLALTTQEIKGGETVSDRVDILEVADSNNVDSIVTKLSENPNVLVAEKNSYIQTSALPNDPLLSLEWQFERIDADKTWNQVNNSQAVVVAVIDTGLNLKHPDLIGKTVTGYDYVNGTSDMKDLSGHGTEVSGCIAAVSNNNIGISGIAGTANVKIAPYRVGGTYDNDANLDVGYICAALYDAAGRSDVKVINMSFGGYDASAALRTAVENAANAGKVLVAAAGNEGSNADYSGEFAIPASYNNVISVGATTDTNEIAYFSQHNSMVDLCAPGYKIYTTNHDGDYQLASGTSFSSPITAGACAVLLAANPSLTNTKVETILENTALDFGAPGKDDYYGYGMIQLDAALAAVTPSIPLSIDNFTANKIPDQTVGTPIVLSASASGGQGSYSYGFYYELNGETNTIQNYSTSNTTTFTPTIAGIYTLYVEVKDGDNNITRKAINNFVIKDSAVKTTSIAYRTHVENIGWQDFVSDGALSGTTDQSLRLEGIEINASAQDYNLGVEYKTHVQDIGWQNFVADGTMSGTTGQSLRLEAIQIDLTGTDADLFDIYYQVHAQNVGWLGWAKNGASAGTAGLSYRLEGIRIQIVPKGSTAPGSTDTPFISN
ncbi:S8 family serine peptidase [Acetobacterium tundrae]|uniref:S8 family serine peptidase n=1 Tax=Acetobacterium tundrae TaxID=132932 RepID=A0ABR6WQ08_9FIRM|nr:S8 family serine peptidase [Acetobacterium tundrae]MBC3798573.1 S8 family serine peptidase [Acetobacterium tundrae]